MEFLMRNCCKSDLGRCGVRIDRNESWIISHRSQLTVAYVRLLPEADKGTKVVADFPK